MATGTVILPIAAATLPDGSSGNAAPAMQRIQGTEANPKKHFLVAAFDQSTDEHLWWSFRAPVDMASTPALVLKLLWMGNLASGNSVVWGVRIGAVTAADADTPVEHVTDTATTATTAGNATEARRLIETSITIADADRDALAAGDLCVVLVYRDADNGSDTFAADAELIAASLEYTTA